MSATLIPLLLNQTIFKKPDFVHVRAALYQINRISKDIKIVLPDFLKDKTKISILEKQTLVVFVPNNSLATRIRYLSPNILEHLQKLGWDIVRLKIRINFPVILTRPIYKKESLSIFAIHHIEELMNAQEESILKDALKKMLNRHKKNKDL